MRRSCEKPDWRTNPADPRTLVQEGEGTHTTGAGNRREVKLSRVVGRQAPHYLVRGGVAITETCCKPNKAVCRVRGMGVAVSVSMWQSADSPRSFALSAAPKRCSSSMTTRARSL